MNLALGERLNQSIKQTDANMELAHAQWTGKHSDLQHRVASVGDSLAHLAQQQYDLSGLQEKQQLDFSALAAEQSTIRPKLDEKLAAATAALQNSLSLQSKAHLSALAEMRYDLLQLTSRVALQEQLLRYGSDVEDFSAERNGGGGNGSGGNSAKSKFGGDGRGDDREDYNSSASMLGRADDSLSTSSSRAAADADLRAKINVLQATVDSTRSEGASMRLEFDTRLDAFKVALAALRTQYEADVETLRTESEEGVRKIIR